MSSEGFARDLDLSDRADEDSARQREAAPTGKPYDWQLPVREDPELVALPPESLAERAFVRSAAFQSAMERAAAYLVVVSRTNAYEGRDPLLIKDDVRCGDVSGFLGLEIDVLARALLEMQRRGLVSTTADGNLHLDDIQALDRLSEGREAAA